MSRPFDRRQFLSDTGAALSALAAGCVKKSVPGPDAPLGADDELPAVRKPYAGPNVIVVRFGGGVRRLETVVSPEKTFCPFVYHELAAKHGVMFRNVEIASKPGVETSHGQGTLYLLTGRYDHYEDITHKPFSDRFEPKAPTLFEYFRRLYDVPAHQALIINGEDRVSEEFYTFSNHHLFGVDYKSEVLSLYRYKTHLLRKELAKDDLSDRDRAEKQQKLAKLDSTDYRNEIRHSEPKPIHDFWEDWERYFGRSGMVNPRGDRLLTELALRALRTVKPKLLLLNYQDPDYVHWGDPHFYTRAISIIDDGIRQLWDAVQADDVNGYRDNTVFVVVPDCGRDSNRAMAVPYQHHFGTKSSHEIFAVVAGPKKLVPHEAEPIRKLQQQISVAATVGEVMGFHTPHADAPSLFKEV